MTRYIIISIVSGILFGIMDAVIHANPLAQKLFKYLEPVAKTSVNVPVGLVIDLVYGFVMAAIFLLLYHSLPGEAGLVKGLSFGLVAWFFRVVMYSASQWMMVKISLGAVLYTLGTGLVEMLILGILYGVTLRPTA